MKRLNYNSSIKQLFSIVLMSILFSACVEDEIFKDQVEEGIPVEVSFDFAIPAMDKVSTRLTDQDEFQVNDLYVFIFNSAGEKKIGSKYYSSKELSEKINQGQGGTNTGKLTLKTTSGESYIYGVSNVKGNELNDLETSLDAVKNKEDLLKITATLSNPNNIDRVKASLVMSGVYTDNTDNKDGHCTIGTDAKQSLKGRIILTRLDSHITFNIKPLMKGMIKDKKNGVIKSFELKSYKVYNIPVKSNVIAQAEDAVGDVSADYGTSDEKINFGKDGFNYSFDFYMLENLKKGKNGITTYAEREKEEKDEETGQNTGIYTNVEAYATFVEIKAKMEIENADAQSGIRVADVKYVVHLGYVNNDAMDFGSKRNKKYTYNIQINNVDDIVTEVREENEKQPGVEGDVVDAKTKVFNLDAHYGCLILGFTVADVTDLKFFVKTPFAETTQETNFTENRSDYKWIKFVRNTGLSSANKLTQYPKDKNNITYLSGLEADVKERAKGKAAGDKTIYYYTVYVDEYYYNEPPCDGLNWGKPYWHHFVNQRDDRYALLILSPKYSSDHDSSYAEAKYMISQKSIQTYYDHSDTGLGMEHVNETGVPAWTATTDHSSKNGLYNTYTYIKQNLNWSNYANMTTPDNNSFKMKGSEALAECLSRNRDENGDGKIELNELKWFLPSTEQLVGMFIGAKSLSTPLFGADDKRPNVTNNKTEGTYHYATSNKERIWSEEGASFGGWTVDYAGSVQKLRCVRNLESIDGNGNIITDKVVNKDDKFVKDIFEYNESEQIITIKSMNKNSLRNSFISSGEIGIHDNFIQSDANSPYTSFKVAQERASIGGKEEKTTWSALMNIDKKNNSVCADYAEKTDKSDKGLWRAPNQRELMIMYIKDSSWVANGAYCRTAWKFDGRYHFGVDGNNIFMDRNDASGTYIRCVRDIK